MNRRELLNWMYLWRDDLRTTSAPQMKGTLGDEALNTPAFCCLGRLCVTTGETQHFEFITPTPVHHPVAFDVQERQLIDLGISDIAYWQLNDELDMTFQEIADILDIQILELEERLANEETPSV